MKYLGIAVCAIFVFLASCSSGTGRHSALVLVDDSELPPDTVVVRHDRPPTMIYEEEPEYPRLAKEGGFSGNVGLKVFVNNEGKPVKAKVVTIDRPNMGFEEAAIKAAYATRYEPARLAGKAVGVWITYRVIFDPTYGIKRTAISSHNLK